MITKFFIPELNNHDVQELWFQQDGATCHTARATIDLLKDTFGDRLISRFGPVNWPPRSCDSTPLDYFLHERILSMDGLNLDQAPQDINKEEFQLERVHLQAFVAATYPSFAAERTCTLQWISVHGDIVGNEQADNLAKEERNSLQLSNSLTLTDADALARRKLSSHPVKKHFILDLNCKRVISTTTARLSKDRLRTRYFKRMKISSDSQRSYTLSWHLTLP
ncbi:RNase H domain-containing protein [Trichonephila clavipes]|nr:RNase H domain-containing protein [Trichonephila clavipes]